MEIETWTREMLVESRRAEKRGGPLAARAQWIEPLTFWVTPSTRPVLVMPVASVLGDIRQQVNFIA